MKKKLIMPARLFTVLAFVLLWVTQGLYYFLEFTLNIRIYIFEGIWCTLVFSLCLFGAPRLVSFLVNLAGFIALINVYAIKEGTEGFNHFAPVLIFAVMLFIVWQYETAKDNTFITQICQNLFLILPLIVLALIIYGVLNRNIPFSTDTIYFTLIGLCVSALYFFCAWLFNKNRKNDKDFKQNGLIFLIAGVLVLEGSAYSIVFSRLELSNCVPALWVASFLLLLELKHPVCVNTANRFKTILDGFLKPKNDN